MNREVPHATHARDRARLLRCCLQCHACQCCPAHHCRRLLAGTEGYHTRIPALVVTGKGTLLAICEVARPTAAIMAIAISS